jgi:D-aspartate ligase
MWGGARPTERFVRRWADNFVLRNETLKKPAVDLMRRVGYGGIADMECRYDRRDDQYKLLHIAPRPDVQLRLFVDSNGMYVVRALYLYLAGQSSAWASPR